MAVPAFIEERIPDDMNVGFAHQADWFVQVVRAASGKSQRIAPRSRPERIFTASYELRKQATNGDYSGFAKIYDWYMATGGGATGFRVRNWMDYFHDVADFVSPSTAIGTSAEMAFGVGDGAETDFQITKTYETPAAGASVTLDIRKPVNDGNLIIYQNGVPGIEGVTHTIDYTTGIVTFTSPPTNTVVLAWTGTYDVPVYWDPETIFDASSPGAIATSIESLRLIEDLNQ